jgi:hypothetical protein
MAAIPSFSLDAAISGQPKEIGSVGWVSERSVSILSLAPYPDDEALAVVATESGHNAIAGEKVFLLGYGFMIDGQYTVIEHPHPEVDKATCFVIERPKKLTGQLTGGLLRRSQEYDLYHPDHLAHEGTMELKLLRAEQMVNGKAMLKYQEVAEQAMSLKAETADLIASLPIPKAKVLEFETDLNSANGISDPDILKDAIAEIKEKYGITDAAFEDRVITLASKYQDFAESVDIDPQDFYQVFELKASQINKRMIEILCGMPKGLMDALDNMSGITDHIASLGMYVSDRQEAASKIKKPAGNGMAGKK